MKTIQFIKTAVVAASIALAAPAVAQEYSFKFQSSDPAGNPNYEIKSDWAERVGEMTGGRVEIEVLPVGSIVAHQETLDAISAGILDGHLTDPGYFSGKDPAFGLLGNPVGAWSDPDEMLRFIEYGGGRELFNELLNPYGLHFIGAAATGLEAFVSKVPLDGVDDLQGLKMRAPEGLVQSVFAAAGAAPVNLPGSEVFTSLDKGVIDAADYTVFSTNQAQGLHDVAKHPVYPGFHSLPTLEVSMNKAKWDALPADIQSILMVSVRDLGRDMVSRLAMADQRAIAEVRAAGDVTIHNWSAEERNRFRTIAQSQWEVVAERSDMAGKVYETLTSYLTEQGLLN